MIMALAIKGADTQSSGRWLCGWSRRRGRKEEAWSVMGGWETGGRRSLSLVFLPGRSLGFGRRQARFSFLREIGVTSFGGCDLRRQKTYKEKKKRDFFRHLQTGHQCARKIGEVLAQTKKSFGLWNRPNQKSFTAIRPHHLLMATHAIHGRGKKKKQKKRHWEKGQRI